MKLSIIILFLLISDAIVAQNKMPDNGPKISCFFPVTDTNFSFLNAAKKNSVPCKLPDYKLNAQEIKQAKYIHAAKNTNYYKRNSPPISH